MTKKQIEDWAQFCILLYEDCINYQDCDACPFENVCSGQMVSKSLYSRCCEYINDIELEQIAMVERYVCPKCGQELCPEEISRVYEHIDYYYVVFKCACGYYDGYNIDKDALILFDIPLSKFISLVDQRESCCGGCERRTCTLEFDGIEPCDKIERYIRTSEGCPED